VDPTLDLPGDDALEPLPTTRVGMVLGGRWRLEAKLGRGGMGEVWRARHVTLGRDVAIKVMHPAFATSASQVQRMMREARAASAVRHPNIVRVEDVGLTDQRVPYIVQEYLDGEDLAAFARRSGNRLDPEVLIPLVAKVLEALAALHAQGVVHRDIKPENVFLVREGDGLSPRLLDFGIAALTNPEELRLTASASMLGTPAYMSPEQFRSTRNVDARTDLWSTGVMLYELLSGALPFPAETFAAMVIAVTSTDPIPLGDKVPSLPSALAGVVMRCLRRDPAERFGDALALRDALLGARTAGAPSLRPSTPPAVPVHRAPRGLAVGLMASGLLVVAAWFARGTGSPAVEAPAPVRPPPTPPVTLPPPVIAVALTDAGATPVITAPPSPRGPLRARPPRVLPVRVVTAPAAPPPPASVAPPPAVVAPPPVVAPRPAAAGLGVTVDPDYH
jgi:hypothetical protein